MMYIDLIIYTFTFKLVYIPLFFEAKNTNLQLCHPKISFNRDLFHVVYLEFYSIRWPLLLL